MMSNPKDNSPPWGALGGTICKRVSASTELEIYTVCKRCKIIFVYGGDQYYLRRQDRQ